MSSIPFRARVALPEIQPADRIQRAVDLESPRQHITSIACECGHVERLRTFAAVSSRDFTAVLFRMHWDVAAVPPRCPRCRT